MKETYEPLLLTIADVARVLKVGRTTVYALTSAGDLPVCRIGRSVRIPVRAVREYALKLEGQNPN